MPEEQEDQVTCIRIEFNDGSMVVIDHQNLKHLSEETRNKLDSIWSIVDAELEEARKKAEAIPGGQDLGVAVHETVKAEVKLV